MSSSNDIKLKELMTQIQRLETDVSEAKRVERFRSKQAWLKIKLETRVADEKYLGYKRQWQVGAREVDQCKGAVKGLKLDLKRIKGDIKLAKMRAKTAAKQQELE